MAFPIAIGISPGTSPLSAKKATLADILAQARNNSFRYVYDIGDDWRHTVKLEAVVDAEPEATYPRLLSAQGRCPPEDVGGTWGYAQYLEAMADPAGRGPASCTTISVSLRTQVLARQREGLESPTLGP